MMLLYVVNYIDRVNVGFAALTMNADLGFSPARFGFGRVSSSSVILLFASADEPVRSASTGRAPSISPF